MEVTLNELSCEPIASHRATALQHMSRLIAVIRELAKYGVKRSLRTLRSFPAQQLAPDYLVAQWLNDPGVQADERIFLKTIATKAPYLDDVLRALEEQQERLFSFRCEGREVIGLGVAYLFDCPAASLGCNQACLHDPIDVQMISVDSQEEVDRVVQVCCVSSVSQVTARAGWLRGRVARENEMRDGPELWQKRTNAWPHLVFADDVEAHVSQFKGSEQFFSQIIRHLTAVNDAVSGWTSGRFSLDGVLWSYESESTMKRADLAELRRFRFPDGEARICEAHTKLLGANIRIHFAVEQPQRRAYIGYIGRHLPTAGG